MPEESSYPLWDEDKAKSLLAIKATLTAVSNANNASDGTLLEEDLADDIDNAISLLVGWCGNFASLRAFIDGNPEKK